VVGSIDNILRPMFVGNRLRMHTIPAFISIVGGLVLFGAPGFILGPLAATMTMLLVEIWMQQKPSSQTSD
jgi:predicted PurR-regulated permease PerM